MSNTTKPFTDLDANQVQQLSYNPINATMAVDGFVVGAIGRQITRTLTNSTTETYNFYENSGATLLYTIQIVYTDSSLNTISSVTRTA